MLAQLKQRFSRKTSADLVKEIHSTLSNSADFLVKRSDAMVAAAQNILDTEDVGVVSRLTTLGFGASKSVQHFEIARSGKAKAARILDYKERYPFNKFVTMDIIEPLCKKYGLLMMRTNKFVGEIPLRNQQEIAKFKVGIHDYNSATLLPGEESWQTDYDHFDYHAKRLREIDDTDDTWEINYHTKKMESYCGQRLFILAPPAQLNLKRMKLNGIFAIKDDPIVLCPVHGGFLIVSMWGPEANDISVQNEKLN